MIIVTIPDLQRALEVYGQPSIQVGRAATAGIWSAHVTIILLADAGKVTGSGIGEDATIAISSAVDDLRAQIERKRSAAVPR